MNTSAESAMIATVVEPGVRLQVDAAAHGSFTALHAESVSEALRAVRERPVRAVFVSPGCIERDELPRVALLVDGFPGVRTVALVSRLDRRSSERLLDLGAHGVRRIVDLSDRRGWQHLRDVVSHPSSPSSARIFGKLIPALGEPTEDCRCVFEAVVRLAPGVTSVKAIATRLGVHPSTLMSRFFRAELPSPKRYLVATRIVYAAALLELPGLSLADAAYRLQYSSPQSFGRHVRAVLGTTANEFRARYSFDAALEEFLERLIIPFRRTFQTFHPLDPGVGYLGQTW